MDGGAYSPYHRPVTLWERAEPLQVLDDLLRSTASGGWVALLPGEAGIGKSALVTEFARRAGNRARVWWGGCDRLTTPRALGPLHDIGRQAGGALAERLRSDASQEEVFSAFLDALAGPEQRPRPVVVVEDVHWADEATLDWLTFTARRIGRFPALLVITYRDDEVGPEHPLRGALAALPRAQVRRVPLAPLTADCVAEQSILAGRDAEQVLRLTGGNPLLVSEVLATDAASIPEAVQDLVLDRLRGLPDAARDLAQLVSVVPSRADAVLVAGAADAVETCLAAGVLVPDGEGVAFRHEVLRNAVEDVLSPPRRVALHGQVLGVLRGVPGVDPGRLVHHAALAGDVDAVLRFGREAGVAASRQGAHREAAAHLQAAAAHADRLPLPERAELFEQYAAEAARMGRYSEALAARDSAAALREELDQPVQVGENLRVISWLAWWTGYAERAHAAAERAVAVLDPLGPTRELARSYVNLAQFYLTAGRSDEAVDMDERAGCLADELGDVETAVDAAINVGTTRLLAGDLDAQPGLRAAHERAAAHGLLDQAARALLYLGSVTANELALFRSGAPMVEAALRYTERHELIGYTAYLLGLRARLRLELGDWDAALVDARTALDTAGHRSINAVFPLVVLGRIGAARADPAAGDLLDDALREASHVSDPLAAVPVAEARSEYFLWTGDTERAQAEARRGLALAAAAHDQPFAVGRLAYRLWRGGGTDEPPPAAAEPFRMMIRGDWAGAAAEWDRRGGRYLQAEALSTGDQAAAVQALRTFDEWGAVRAAEHVRSRMREQGFSGIPRGPQRATQAHPAGLTPRQAEVLTLLAEGLSNPEIARRLTLSPKTVDHHVSAVLGRLGVSNRAQAAAASLRWQPGSDV
jgi:DNA-binding CsgD family transcriptional regulator/tetratricopeptide (TPR) repeat protein